MLDSAFPGTEKYANPGVMILRPRTNEREEKRKRFIAKRGKYVKYNCIVRQLLPRSNQKTVFEYTFCTQNYESLRVLAFTRRAVFAAAIFACAAVFFT